MNIRTDTFEEKLSNWYASLRKSQKVCKDKEITNMKSYWKKTKDDLQRNTIQQISQQ